LLNGGGLNCVLATAYQPKSDTTEKQVKTTPKDEFKHQSYKIPDIEISSDMIENIMVVGGVVLGILLISRLRSK
jgi:F0F1-type ATP synthase assembly protein I